MRRQKQNNNHPSSTSSSSSPLPHNSFYFRRRFGSLQRSTSPLWQFYDSTVVAAVVLCGAMARASEKGKKTRDPTAADIQAAGETVRRLQAARKTKADKQRQVRDTLKPTAAKSPPAKRSKKQHQQEHIRRRGSGSGSGTAKPSGTTDVVVLSDVEGSEKKLRGGG